MIDLDDFDLVASAEDQRHALVQVRRHDVQYPLAAGTGAATGLLDQER